MLSFLYGFLPCVGKYSLSAFYWWHNTGMTHNFIFNKEQEQRSEYISCNVYTNERVYVDSLHIRDIPSTLFYVLSFFPYLFTNVTEGIYINNFALWYSYAWGSVMIIFVVFCVVLLCVFTFWVPSCAVYYYSWPSMYTFLSLMKNNRKSVIHKLVCFFERQLEPEEFDIER